MPTDLDLEMIPEVLSIIQENGVQVVLVSAVGTYDVASGSTSQSSTAYPGYMTPPYPVSRKYVNGTSILATDMQAYLAAGNLSVVPVPGWSIIFGGQSLTLVEANPIYTGEQVALYQLLMR